MYGGTPGTSEWEVRRTVDTDFDGAFLSTGEGWRFAYDGASRITYLENMQHHTQNGISSIFAVASGDMIIQMVDLDGDGLATGIGEIIDFVDTRTAHGVSNTSPDDLAFDPNNGMLYVCDDLWSSGPQPGSGISSYIDLDSNGDCNGPGEMALMVDGQGSITLQEPSGPVDIGITDFEALMVDSLGVVIGFEQQDRALYAFRDNNGDGDAMDSGECWNFLNLVGDKAGLEVNADVAAGTLRNPSCPSNTGTGLYASLEWLDVDHNSGPNGEDVYWICSTTYPSTCSGANGLIYRGVDNNNDNDLNDPGEVTLFFDGPSNVTMVWPPTLFYGADAHDGGISIFHNAGPAGPSYPQNGAAFLKDLNGDGDAMGNGEQSEPFFWSPDGCYAVCMTTAPIGEFWSPPPASWDIFGSPGTTSAGNQPSINATGIPSLGSLVYITLANAIPSSPIILIAGFSDSQWNQFTLPLDLAFVGAPGNTLYVSAHYQFPGAADAAGGASFALGIPGGSSWIDKDIYFQWYCIDPPANTRGAVLSDALHGIIR
ncbi:MAG TPA: hypothetical protein DDW23_03675 [Planctomycetes bacterium]|nr:hypothetical protein [Planctomycetota bacterium]